MSGKNTPYINFWNWHSNHSKSDEFARKKSIIIHDLNWCQKLPGIILVTSTNFILKNILVKVPFWAKTMVPYESRKREKIHISYIMHPRKISLILIFNFFQPLLGLVSSPHSHFSIHSLQSQFHFQPAVAPLFKWNWSIFIQEGWWLHLVA